MHQCKECGLTGILPLPDGCPEHKEPEETITGKKYYCYGSGMFGCLYDYGPNFCKDVDDAICDFDQVFSESIDPDELIEMRNNLRESGRHSFRDPLQAGAQYCDVSEEFGEMPESDDD